ncbi:MAG: CHAD domain-containing protein [Acidobacteriota bacterium]
MTESALPADFLTRSPEESARLQALQLLTEAAQAKERLVLVDPDDEEALHDFRVALRRLRSTLRAYRPVMADAVPRKLQRRLANLADSTNAARDAEVQLDWLRRTEKDLPGPARRGAAWLIAGLEAVEESERERGRSRAAARFDKLDAALRKRLQSFRVEYDLGHSPPRRTFGAWLGALLVEHAAELREDLGAISSLADVEASHRARIAAKRLRYLLEPLRACSEGAAPLVERLKSLQDELGDLHDAQVLVQTLADTLAEAAAERARQRVDLALQHGSTSSLARAAGRAATPPGFLLLVDRLQAEQIKVFIALQRHWLTGKSEPFLDDVEQFARTL